MSQSATSKPRPGVLSCSLSVLAIFTLLLGCAGPPKHPTWNNATGAEQYERLMWQAIRNRDWTSFERQLAPAFIGADGTGTVFDRAAWVEHWKQSAIGDYSLGEVVIQPAGADLVITYVVSLTGSNPANRGVGSRMRVVSVWQQVKSRMVLTTSSITPVQGN
jgi:uncharacterized protein DUF4440